jgi:type II secretory pathway component GspD/PulD (secretin)
MTPEQMQMQQQQAMMRAQQQQQQGQQPQPQKDKPPINLVINARKNSIVANAPPDKMAIIEQAVKVLDVPKDGAEELLANVNRMQVYRLAAVDPEALVETLNDLGVLHPTTRLQVDKRNKSIIAHAPMMDHLTIRALVSKLDGSGRKFEVIQLRRLEADYVAGSIDFMMGGADKEKNQQRRPFYYDFGYYGSRQQEETSSDKFRVDADVENNRLLLWANQIELEEVMNLLAKLGEVPGRGGNTNTVRVLNLEPGKATDDALDRIRRAWPSLSPNPLVVPPSDQSSEAAPPRDRTKATEAPARVPSIKTNDTRSRETRSVPKVQSPLDEPSETVAVVAAPAVLRRMKEDRVAAAQSSGQGGASNSIPDAATKESEKPRELPTIKRDGVEDTAPADIGETAPPRAAKTADENGAIDADRQRLRQQVEDALKENGRGRTGGNVPIVVNRGPNGELIVSSPDTEALDLFEEMINEVGPPRKDYHVFYLKHGFAFWVATKLEDYFEVEDSSKKNNNRGYPYFYFDDYGSSNTKNETRRLSRRRPLKFISDTDTNTILVTGADPNQLKIIEQLIKVYDQPEPMDSRAARMTKVFQLKYSKAKVVGETVKDVYRDLLSSNDKALQQQQGDQKNKRPESQNTYITNFGGGEDDGKPTEVRFKGKLSIGIDELSNTLVVSTEGENLLNNVTQLIEALDNAARPSLNTVRVMQIGGSMDSKDVRKALARALIDQQRQQQQQRPGQQQPGQNQQQQQQQFQQQPMDENGNVIEQ